MLQLIAIYAIPVLLFAILLVKLFEVLRTKQPTLVSSTTGNVSLSTDSMSKLDMLAKSLEKISNIKIEAPEIQLPEINIPDITLPDIHVPKPELDLFPKEQIYLADENRFDVHRIGSAKQFTFHEIYDKKYNTVSVIVETNDGDIIPLVNSYQR